MAIIDIVGFDMYGYQTGVTETIASQTTPYLFKAGNPLPAILCDTAYTFQVIAGRTYLCGQREWERVQGIYYVLVPNYTHRQKLEGIWRVGCRVSGSNGWRLAVPTGLTIISGAAASEGYAGGVSVYLEVVIDFSLKRIEYYTNGNLRVTYGYTDVNAVTLGLGGLGNGSGIMAVGVTDIYYSVDNSDHTGDVTGARLGPIQVKIAPVSGYESVDQVTTVPTGNVVDYLNGQSTQWATRYVGTSPRKRDLLLTHRNDSTNTPVAVKVQCFFSRDAAAAAKVNLSVRQDDLNSNTVVVDSRSDYVTSATLFLPKQLDGSAWDTDAIPSVKTVIRST